MIVWTFRGPQEPFSSDEGGEADKENMQYAVPSCTRQLVEKSEEVLQVIAAYRENTQGDIQEVKNSLQSVQAEQTKVLHIDLPTRHVLHF